MMRQGLGFDQWLPFFGYLLLPYSTGRELHPDGHGSYLEVGVLE